MTQRDTIEQQDATTGGNTPKPNHLYAVFDAAGEAEQAARALVAAGFGSQRLHPHVAAATFKEPDASTGPLAKLERLVKRVGGETHDAERYAAHLDHGRAVLCVEAPNRDAAVRIAASVKQHGGYDVTYFSALAKEYMSPEANARHGLPSFASTNMDSVE